METLEKPKINLTPKEKIILILILTLAAVFLIWLNIFILTSSSSFPYQASLVFTPIHNVSEKETYILHLDETDFHLHPVLKKIFSEENQTTVYITDYAWAVFPGVTVSLAEGWQMYREYEWNVQGYLQPRYENKSTRCIEWHGEYRKVELFAP